MELVWDEVVDTVNKYRQDLLLLKIIPPIYSVTSEVVVETINEQRKLTKNQKKNLRRKEKKAKDKMAEVVQFNSLNVACTERLQQNDKEELEKVMVTSVLIGVGKERIEKNSNV